VISAVKASGPLTDKNRQLITTVKNAFNIPEERHKAEIRRAVADRRLNRIAET